MVDLTHKHDLGRFVWEVLKRYLELQLGVLEETVPDEEDAMPD